MTVLTNQNTTVRPVPVRDIGQSPEIDPGIIPGEEVVFASPYGNTKKKNKQRKPALLPTEGRRNFDLEAKQPKTGVSRMTEKSDEISSKKSTGAVGSSSSSEPEGSSSEESSDFSYSTLTGSGVALSILAIIDAMNAQLEASIYKKEQAVSMMDAQYGAALQTSELTMDSAEQERDMARVEGTKQFVSAGLSGASTAGTVGYSQYKSGGLMGYGKDTSSAAFDGKIQSQQTNLDTLKGNADLVVGPKVIGDPTLKAEFDARKPGILDGTDPRFNQPVGTPSQGPNPRTLEEDFASLENFERQTVRNKVGDNIRGFEDNKHSISNDMSRIQSQVNMFKDFIVQGSGGFYDFQRGDLAFEKGAIDAEKVMADLAMRNAGESVSQFIQNAGESDRQALEAISLLRQMQQANEVRG